MKSTIIRDALRIAQEKLPAHPQFDYWPHYTFVVQSNKIVEWGYNTPQEPAKHLGYNARISHGVSKTHAELNAYRAAKGLLNPNKSFEIVNIRLSRQGSIRNSQPCACCFSFLSDLGCTHCWFSTDCGFAKIGM